MNYREIGPVTKELREMMAGKWSYLIKDRHGKYAVACEREDLCDAFVKFINGKIFNKSKRERIGGALSE